MRPHHHDVVALSPAVKTQSADGPLVVLVHLAAVQREVQAASSRLAPTSLRDVDVAGRVETCVVVVHAKEGRLIEQRQGLLVDDYFFLLFPTLSYFFILLHTFSLEITKIPPKKNTSNSRSGRRSGRGSGSGSGSRISSSSLQ